MATAGAPRGVSLAGTAHDLAVHGDHSLGGVDGWAWGLELLTPIAVPSCDQGEALPLVECSEVV